MDGRLNAHQPMVLEEAVPANLLDPVDFDVQLDFLAQLLNLDAVPL